MKQIADPVVHRRRGDEQDTRTDHGLRERAVAISVGVSEAVGLVDDKQAARGGTGRRRAAPGHAEGLMRDDRGVYGMTLKQAAPLWLQHSRYDQRERLAERAGDRERDVRLAEADPVREQGAAIAREDADEPLRGGGLGRGGPCPPRRLAFDRERREGEQGARPARGGPRRPAG